MDIDVIGFVGDCLVSGRMDLTADRLTDQLNADAELTLHDVILEGLDGGRVDVDTFTIARSELCAVVGSGPRGAETLRVETDARRLQAQIGPYMVLGRYHGPVGATSLRTFSEREPMVPLTDVTIAYVVNGFLEARDVPVLIINRELAAWYHDPDSLDELDAHEAMNASDRRGPQRAAGRATQARDGAAARLSVPSGRRR